MQYPNYLMSHFSFSMWTMIWQFTLLYVNSLISKGNVIYITFFLVCIDRWPSALLGYIYYQFPNSQIWIPFGVLLLLKSFYWILSCSLSDWSCLYITSPVYFTDLSLYMNGFCDYFSYLRIMQKWQEKCNWCKAVTHYTLYLFV